MLSIDSKQLAKRGFPHFKLKSEKRLRDFGNSLQCSQPSFSMPNPENKIHARTGPKPVAGVARSVVVATRLTPVEHARLVIACGPRPMPVYLRDRILQGA